MAMTSINNKYRPIHKHGITFFTNRSKGNGILQHLLGSCPSDKVVVASSIDYERKTGDQQGTKAYSAYTAVTPKQLSALLKQDVNLFEIMHEDRPQKVAFDIDFKPQPDQTPTKTVVLQEITTLLHKYFPGCRLNISGSITDSKHSYHKILENYFAKRNEDLLAVKQFCCVPEHRALGFDPAVYNNNGQLKAINQSKGDGRIQTYISGSKKVLDHTVMHKIPKDAIDVTTLDLPAPAKKRKYTRKDPANASNSKPKKKVDDYIIELPRMELECPDGFSYHESTPDKQLTAMPNPPRYDKFQLYHTYNRRVLAWCKHVGLTFEDFWEWCKQKDDSPDRKSRYSRIWKDADVNKYPPKDNFMKASLAVVYKNIQKHHPVKQMLQSLNKTFDLDINRRFLSVDDLISNQDKRCILLQLPTGSGKSQAVLELLKWYSEKNPNHCILWLTCRITLTNDQRTRLRDTTGLPWIFYLDAHGSAKKELMKKSNPQYFVCSVQSAYMINKPYDLVIMDESETLLRSFEGEAKCHKGGSKDRRLLHWKILETTITNTKQTIWMDALLTNASVDLAQDLCGGEVFKIGTQPHHVPERNAIRVKSEPDFFNKIQVALQNGEKLLICTGNKGSTTPDSKCFLSVEGIYSTIMRMFPDWEYGKQVLRYHAHRKDEKEGLREVLSAWGHRDIRVVIGNSSLAVGVNYDPTPEQQKDYRLFDKVFVVLQPPALSPRDSTQVVGRVRKTTTNEIYYLATRGGTGADFYHNDGLADSLSQLSPAYARLRKNMRTETLVSSCKGYMTIVREMFLMNNIVMAKDDIEAIIEEDEEEKANEFCNTDLSMYRWKNIRDITEDEKKKILQLMFYQDATITQILELYKYNFRERFISIEEGLYELYWDRFKPCADQLHMIGITRRKDKDLPEEHQYEMKLAARHLCKLFQENNVDIMNPDKFKITKDFKWSVQLHEIKRIFDFLSRPPTTLRMDLFAKVLNTAFGTELVYKDFPNEKNRKYYEWKTKYFPCDPRHIRSLQEL
ncbi:hypothetical protein BC832DRAFT_592890 [Gaertneriomyces semiglobifer]|nr:hypothetical protein BC832DRAFT_592890 [Gaertneriomyces semiglobifer]